MTKLSNPPKIIYSFNEIDVWDTSTAITLGNFDGLHVGHRMLLEATLSFAEQNQLKSVAVTFTPTGNMECLPLEKRFLYSPSQRIRIFHELGIDVQIEQKVREDFARISKEVFYQHYLLKKLNASYLVVGENFRFGFQRAGDAAYLRCQAKKDGVQTYILPLVQYAGEVVNSTRIRREIHQKGAVEMAAELLGRPFALEGKIVKGDQLGRKLGTPTANLGNIEQLYPKNGIYAGCVAVSPSTFEENTVFPSLLTPSFGDLVPAVINVGIRPTTHSNRTSSVCVEAHLLEGEYPLDSLYGKHATYYFLKRIRNETAFPSLNNLKEQIEKDKQEARKKLME